MMTGLDAVDSPTHGTLLTSHRGLGNRAHVISMMQGGMISALAHDRLADPVASHYDLLGELDKWWSGHQDDIVPKLDERQMRLLSYAT